MSEAATEKVEATKPVENGSTEAKTETKDEKPTEATNGNGEAKKDDLDEFGRKRREGKDDRDRSRSPDRRDRSDRKRDYDRRDRWSKDDRGRGRGGRGGRGRGGRGGGRGGYNNDRRNNVRTKFAREEESSDAQEIRRQVEFYFSDSNLPIDKFLLEETGGPENKPFPLKTIHNFKRMRHFQPFSAIVEAVKGSDFLVVNDKDEVYRKEPLDSKFTDDVQKNSELLTTDTMKRSLYVKGFGKESEKTAFEIEEFFEPYGAKSVRLRRSDDGTFKGSVFVEFEDEDAAKQFLEMDDKPKYNDQDLEVMTKQAYVDMKSQMILEGKVKPKSPTRSGFRRNNDRGGRRGSFNGGYKRKRYDDNDDDVDDKDNWRERRERFQKGRGRDEERSRSRSPYRGEKEDADKGAEKTETEEVKTEAKAEEVKPEEAKAEA